MLRRILPLTLLLAATLVVQSPAQATLMNPSHVVVIVFENHEFERIIGNPEAPYFNSLAQTYALATQYYALRLTSLPNYIGILGGSTHNITSNKSTKIIHGSNLASQIDNNGRTWKAYMEDMPSPCFKEDTYDNYVRKHNPFMYFNNIVNTGRCQNVVPMSQLQTDLDNHSLPNLVWITPNQCHNMHDCPVSTGDSWLQEHLPPILDQLSGNDTVYITFDEGEERVGCCGVAYGGRIATIVAGPGARHGIRVNRKFQHFSLLRTIEGRWNLVKVHQAACTCTLSMTRLLR